MSQLSWNVTRGHQVSIQHSTEDRYFHPWLSHLRVWEIKCQLIPLTSANNHMAAIFNSGSVLGILCSYAKNFKDYKSAVVLDVL